MVVKSLGDNCDASISRVTRETGLDPPSMSSKSEYLASYLALATLMPDTLSVFPMRWKVLQSRTVFTFCTGQQGFLGGSSSMILGPVPYL